MTCTKFTARTRLKLRPGQRGTKRLVKEYGDKLVCVRYRYDVATNKRYTTIEIIVAEGEWKRRSPASSEVYQPDNIVEVRVSPREHELVQQLRAANAVLIRQRPEQRWQLTFAQAEALGLVDRIEPDLEL